VEQFLTYTFLGLVLGAVYAIAASGLVLTYTTSGIFNFAHGAQAMLAAFVYWQLTVPWGLPALAAFVLVVGVFGPLMGMALHQVLMKGLRDVAEVTKVVVTVSVLLAMVSLSTWIWAPAEPRTIELLFGSTNYVDLGGVKIRYGEMFVVGAAVALAVGLRLLFTRTRLGVAMRGVVDDPDLLRLNGFNPERIAMTSWAFGSALAAFAGVVVTPIAGGSLEATTLTLLIIDTFAAAMFGRLRSIPRTFVGAMVLGLAATYFLGYAPTRFDWVSNVRGALPLIVLFVVLLVLPQDRLRGTSQARSRERPRVPSVPQALVWGAAFVVLVVLLSRIAGPAMIGPWINAMAFAIIALSLVPLTGYAGEINLAPLSFGAIGVMVAYHTGIEGIGVDARMTWVGIVAGVVVTAFFGGLVALPALRLRGLYLALATVAFGGIMSTLVLREINPRHWFGLDLALFPNARLLVPRPEVGPLDLDENGTFLIALSVVFAVLGVLVVVLRNSGYGRRLVAMRDSPAATAMLGQSLIRLKLGVFMFSAAIAGLGGVLIASAQGSVSGDDFLLTSSLVLVMLTVVGGVNYVSGALFGGVIVGVGLSALNGTSAGLGADMPDLEPTFVILGHLGAFAIALTGIGVNRNPSGIVHAISSSYRPLRAAVPVLAGGAGAVALLVVLNLAGALDDWSLALLTMVIVLALPAIGARLMPERVLTAEQLAERAAPRDTSPELLGLDVPLTTDERLELDAGLGLPAGIAAAMELREDAETVVVGEEGSVHVPA
jgi:branched-chain amino acid transport system permease protein